MKRLGGAAAACARRGDIASSNGSAIAAPPAPRRIVRRDRRARSRRDLRRAVAERGHAHGRRATIFLKSPSPLGPLQRGGQRRRWCTGRRRSARCGRTRSGTTASPRRCATWALLGQARGQAGDAVERAVDVGARQRAGRVDRLARRRCRASGRRRRSARTRNRSDPSAGGSPRSSRIGRVLREALARGQPRVDRRRHARRCRAAAAAAACRTAARARTCRAAPATSGRPWRVRPGTTPASAARPRASGPASTRWKPAPAGAGRP